MEIKFKSNDFSKRLKSMLKVDFKRAFSTPLFYILVGICLVIPVLIFVMTTMMGGTTTDAVTGEPVVIETFTNVWQAIGSVSTPAEGESAAMGGMSLTAMCNINMLYFFIAVFVCIFVADDFRSGYAKNLFTVRSKKTDYVISKTVVGFIAGACMLIAYFIGALLGGAIAGLSFDTGTVSAGNIVACMLSKVFMASVFVSIYLAASVFAKQKLWLSILCSLGIGMLFFTMIPMITPLDSGILNVVLCLVGGAGFAVGLGAVSNIILKKTSLV